MNPSVELRAGIFAHWQKCKARGEPMPCAVVVGCPPVISYASVQKLPERCRRACRWRARSPAARSMWCAPKTVDLLVPAEAEIVIEGLINTEWLEPEAPFGESHGYVNLQEYNAFMEVTAITRRRHPILTSFISQVTPSESSVIRRVAMEPVFLDHLKSALSHPRRQAGRDARAADQPLCGDRHPVRARHAGDRNLARAPWRRRRCIVSPANGSSPSTRTSIRKMPTLCSGRCRTAASRSTISEWSPHKDPGHGPRGPRDERRERGGPHQRHVEGQHSRRWRCPSANSWSTPRRSGSGSACRRSSRKAPGTATISAIGRRSWSARREMAVESDYFALGREQSNERRNDVAMNTPVERE